MMKLKHTKESAMAWMRDYDDIRHVGAGPVDEVYTAQVAGSFNMTLMNRVLDNIPAKKLEKITWMADITEEMRQGSQQADVSMARVHAMPIEICFTKPVLFLEQPDGTCVLGDGNHRLRKLIMMGATKVLARKIPTEIVEQFRVRTEVRNRRTGKWEPMDRDVELAVMEGNFSHHHFY